MKRPREPSPRNSDEGIEALKSLLAETTDQTMTNAKKRKTTDQTNTKDHDHTMITNADPCGRCDFCRRRTDAKTMTYAKTMADAKTIDAAATQLESLDSQMLYEMIDG